MLSVEKILVTGPAGTIAFPLASSLTPHNEVWGIARFSQPGSRERVEAAGVKTVVCDAEGTGLLLQHCREAKAALVMSTHSVYKPQEAHDHVFVETDPLGDVNAANTPTYSVAKIGQEAVARYCARAFDLPPVAPGHRRAARRPARRPSPAAVALGCRPDVEGDPCTT